MDQTFDLVVLGTGTAASGVATTCRAAGWSVAIIDELPFGGTCALRGCDPKKVLRRAAEVIDAARLMRGKGLSDSDLSIDWPKLMAFKREFTDPVPARREAGFVDKGIATFNGTAKFVGKTSIAVGGERLDARHVVIATGAKPVPLPLAGSEHVITSTAFLELEELPKRILFIGGGFVSFEFAHIGARAGADVVVLDRGTHPLPAFDPDLVAQLVERTRRLGVTFHPNAAVEAVEKTKDGVIVVAAIDGTTQTFAVDLVVHGAGRAPAVDALDIEAGNVRASKKGIEVNEFLQSVSNPAVYAAGDVAATAGPPLTPVAGLEGAVVASNLLKGNHDRPDYTGVPSAIFTIPALTRVGLLESEARDQGRDVTCKFTDMSEWYSVERVGETHAAAKVVIEKKTERILGFHHLGPESGEIVNLIGLAMRTDLRVPDVKKMISAYPSAGSDIGYLL